MERMLPQNKTTPRTTPKFLTKPENRSLFINWIAGLLGGLASTTIFSPLDLARTRHIILVSHLLSFILIPKRQQQTVMVL